ncbi:MAG: SAVED domain-containing protein [candidate division Zixibacteria bacterium]|nr:SAVED domain-containing protein [candidate division Zixibacteria bacterium]
MESVCLESDKVSFVDDVVVTYREPICDKATGKRISCDYYQCKYHVTQGGAFTYEKLLDPSFISCEESMLKRLNNAYVQLINESKTFRLYVVSNWIWDPADVLARHLSEERIRDTFYKGSSRTKEGMIRSKFAEHLSITETELKRFLNTVRFQLGKNLTDLAKELEPYLKLAGLKPIDPLATTIIYDDLAWELFSQGRNRFDRDSFNDMLKEEKLIVPPRPNYSEISIRSCPQGARRPREFQAAHLDLSELFDGRFPHSKSYWREEIPKLVDAFFRSDNVKNLPQPVYIFFDCHLSIAFLAGNLLNPKFGLQIIPAQKTTMSGYEFWPEPSTGNSGLWNINIYGGVNTEVVVSISVTNPIKNHLLPFLKSTGLERLLRIDLSPVNGIGPKAIFDGTHAWQLGCELQTLLRSNLPSKCHKLHFFFSGPVALAYILGNTLRYVTKTIQLYEHDFEGLSGGPRYYPSMQLPIINLGG